MLTRDKNKKNKEKSRKIKHWKISQTQQRNHQSHSNTVIGLHWPLMGGLLHLVQR